ncbi:MAG: TRAP transporter small permease, partial [Afipia sp.]|nr:TRAP transporter small permease [Afipia sp.]
MSVAINFANVVGRYAFQASIYWAEEAMVYLAIWSIFLAAGAIAFDRAHLTMDFFATRLPTRLKKLSDLTMTLSTAALCLFMAWQSLAVTRILFRNNQNSLALEIPM